MEPGSRLDRYEIVEPLGAGGMGEVYLAQDTRLRREVAIKILPEKYATDPERLTRFEQEARAAAALNHPNIAAVFDIQETNGTRYIVQEYLQGRSLRALLEAGPLPLERALRICGDVADALAVAHDAGVVHRDVKPDNLFITTNGHTKVLDFGLAKLLEPGMQAGALDATMSPTAIGTTVGTVMGTVGYMAPEQVEAGEVDGRTDVFSLGCVLYEMTGGKRPFRGENVHATLGRILSDSPEPVRSLQPGLPVRLEWILEKGLAKDPARRYQHVEDLAVDLRALADSVRDGGEDPSERATGAHPPAAWSAGRIAALVLAGAALLLLGWAIGGGVETVASSVGAGEPIRLTINLPESAPVRAPVTWGSGSLAVSPDGRTLVYAAQTAAGPMLYRRSLARDSVEPILGTEGARNPAISPDGTRVAFAVGPDVRVADLERDGDTVSPVAEARSSVTSLAWIAERELLYSDLETFPAWSVSVDGGPPVQRPAWRQGYRGVPMVLGPLGDGRILGLAGLGELTTFLSPLEGPPVPGPAGVRIMVTEAGAAAFVRDDRLYVARWSPAEPGLLDGQQLVSADVAFDPGWFGAGVAAGGSTLAWLDGGQVDRTNELVVADRDGSETPLPDRRWAEAVRLSPDGHQVLYAVHSIPEGHQIFLHDLRDGSRRQLTSGVYADLPIFGADPGHVLTFHISGTDAGDGLLWIDVVSGEERLVTDVESLGQPGSVHPTESTLVWHSRSEETGRDLYTTPLDGSGMTTPFLQTRADEVNGRFSPDGRYLAYASNETGRTEVYVRAYPAGQPVWKVSEGGGDYPRWSTDGSRLFFIRSLDSVWEAPVNLGDSFTYEPEREIFTTTGRIWDVSGDGQRFVITRQTAHTGPVGSIQVLLNWPSILGSR